MRTYRLLIAPVVAGAFAAAAHAEIVKLSDTIGAPVAVKGAESEKIADLIIDMETERIAYVTLVRNNAKDAVIVPAVDIKQGDQSASYAGDPQALQKAPAAPKKEELNAKRLAKVDKHFGHDPYWKRADKLGKEPEPRLRAGKGILNIEVVDGENEKLGEVTDVALDWESGKIPYIVVKNAKSQRMHAIPIAAFEKTEDDQRLLVKVPPEVFHKGASFSAEDKWPAAIDRQWVEYVQVRYGRRGVQSEGAAEKNDTNKR